MGYQGQFRLDTRAAVDAFTFFVHAFDLMQQLSIEF
jgi:hypothetical protein